jgi:hypothetical protein
VREGPVDCSGQLVDGLRHLIFLFSIPLGHFTPTFLSSECRNKTLISAGQTEREREVARPAG